MASADQEPKPTPILKEGCRILATTFLSLLLPLSFLLLARLSTARYFLSVSDQTTLIHHRHEFPFSTSIFIQLATLILSVLASLVTFAALVHCLTAGRMAAASFRHRLHAAPACILLFLTQVCLSLGIHGTVDEEINSYTVGRLFLPRRLVFAFGLHEAMVFWSRSTVKAVVDKVIFGYSSSEGCSCCSWVEEVAMAVGLANLWWQKLREEAEALVIVPWVVWELGMDVTAADALGCVLYYLAAAVGLIRAAKSVLRVMGRTVLKRLDRNEEETIAGRRRGRIHVTS